MGQMEKRMVGLGGRVGRVGQIGKRRINLHYFTIIETLPLKKALARVGDSPGPVPVFWLGWPGWDKIMREK
jgi:hypothetical protein